MRAVIMAGGLGTRLAGVSGGLPKCLIPVGGKPVIEHQFDNLAKCGIRDITLIVGNLADKVIERLGNGEAFSVNISYIREEAPLGTAGGLFFLRNQINEDFLLINGDIIYDCDFERIIAFHKDKKADITLFTHPNNHPYDSVLINAGGDGNVQGLYFKEAPRPKYCKNLTNAGIHVLSPRVLGYFDVPKKTDLDREVIPHFIGKGTVYACKSPEYVRDMGSPERLERVREDYAGGKIAMRSLKNKQRCVFVDRDGTLNKPNGFISSPESFELLGGVCKAIKLINESGYLCIVITNQPVIARGECSVEALEKIHAKLDALLGEQGCHTDALYYCPHHPDGGFPGEVSKLKIKCGCRKPETGLFLQAARDFNIDFSTSFMLGDSDCDIIPAKTLGMKTGKIGERGNVEADYYADGLLGLVNKLL